MIRQTNFDKIAIERTIETAIRTFKCLREELLISVGFWNDADLVIIVDESTLIEVTDKVIVLMAEDQETIDCINFGLIHHIWFSMKLSDSENELELSVSQPELETEIRR